MIERVYGHDNDDDDNDDDDDGDDDDGADADGDMPRVLLRSKQGRVDEPAGISSFAQTMLWCYICSAGTGNRIRMESR